MYTLEFVKYSKFNRESFLNIASNLKELNIEMILKGEEIFYLKKLMEEYKNFLHKLHNEYIREYNLDIDFDTAVCDFISCMEPQIDDSTYITKNERCLHLSCVEYNMIVNIHKFSYELFSFNHQLNELDFFHGTSLTELLEKREITIEKFREESFYDIDNFSHINLPKDLEYLKLSNMIDIYLLNKLSDILEYDLYKEFFFEISSLNSKGYLSKDEYRYFLTMEDVICAKPNTIKKASNLFLIIMFIASIVFLFYISYKK